MSAPTEAPAACDMCHISPNDPALLEDRGSENAPGYLLCTDRQACLDRAIAAQREASDARLAELRRERDERIAARQKVAGAVPAASPLAPPAGYTLGIEVPAKDEPEAPAAETEDVQAVAETAPEAGMTP